MKNLLTMLIALTSATLIHADDSIPSEVQRIIDIRKNEIKKINEQYQAALERQKNRYIMQGDFERAKVVDELLKEGVVAGQSSGEVDIEGKWHYSLKGTKLSGVRTIKDGFMIHESGEKCLIEREGNRIKIYFGPNGWEYLVIFPENPDIMEGVSSWKGAKATYLRR